MNESKVDWSRAPLDAEFFAYEEFRKERGDGRHPSYWQEDHNIDEGYWENGAFTLHECKEASDYEERPASVVKDPVCTPEDLTKAKDQAEFLHKKDKTSVDFLNIVKDIQEERGAEYEQNGGERSFAKIAQVFNVYRDKDLLPSDIALILEIMKNVRFYAQDRYHEDSVIDKVSYASLWAELVTQERT